MLLLTRLEAPEAGYQQQSWSPAQPSKPAPLLVLQPPHQQQRPLMVKLLLLWLGWRPWKVSCCLLFLQGQLLLLLLRLLLLLQT